VNLIDAYRPIISQNHIVGNAGDGTYNNVGIAVTKATFEALIIGNQILSSGDVGIAVFINSSFPKNTVIKANTIRDSDTDGIQLYSVQDTNIEGNTIVYNGRHGIASVSGQYPRLISITNNCIAKNQQHGITLIDVTDVIVKGNRIYQNSQAGSGTYNGFQLTRTNLDPKNIMVEGNTFQNLNNGTEMQGYAFAFTGSTYLDVTYANNCDKGQVSGNISDSVGGITLINNTNDKSYRGLLIGSKKHVYAAAMPAAGTFSVGDIVYNTAPTIQGVGGSKYAVLGWYRMTTGTAHVLNTDWTELRCLTGA